MIALGFRLTVPENAPGNGASIVIVQRDSKPGIAGCNGLFLHSSSIKGRNGGMASVYGV
jgi:hypothetical protein